VLVLAGFAAESMIRISKTVGSAEASATQLETAASAGDLTGARSALSSLASDMDELSSESDEWIWSLVEKVPYIGTDVTSAKTMVSAMEKVNAQALQPVLTEYDKATAADATAEDRIQAASDLAASLESAQTILEEGRSEIASAPSSHIDALRDLQTKLESSLSAVDSNLQTLNSAVSAASDAASLLASALSAAGLS
jgi:DNA repair exonuclease SbcCD ATPase subunit